MGGSSSERTKALLLLGRLALRCHQADDTVVALLNGGKEVTVKELHREGPDTVRLEPANGEHEALVVPAEGVKLWARWLEYSSSHQNSPASALPVLRLLSKGQRGSGQGGAMSSGHAKERPAAEGGCRRCIKCTLPVKRQIENSVERFSLSGYAPR